MVLVSIRECIPICNQKCSAKYPSDSRVRMLPVGEFKFVVGGLATFAASVGYAFSRRLIADLSVTLSIRIARCAQCS